AGHFGRRLCAALEVQPLQLAYASHEDQGVGPRDLAALRWAWRDATGSARPDFERDGSAEVLAVPSGSVGARLVAAEVLALLEAEELDPRDVLLVSRGSGGLDQDAVALELGRLGVPVASGGTSLGRSRVGRPLLGLVEVLSLPRVSRAKLLDVLTDLPWAKAGIDLGRKAVVDEVTFSGARGEDGFGDSGSQLVPVDAEECGRWDRISRDAGLRLLIATAAAPEAVENQVADEGDASKPGSERDFAAEVSARISYEGHRRRQVIEKLNDASPRDELKCERLQREADSAQRFGDIVHRIARLHRSLARGMAWNDLGSQLRRLLADWVEPSAQGFPDWITRFGTLGRLDKLGVPATGQGLAWVLGGFGGESVAADVATEGVRLAPLAKMRGARPKIAILLNGIESCFPRPPVPQPLLPNSDREQLVQVAPTLQLDELPEERALFGELLDMPTEKLLLVTTFAGLESSRGETPSRFLMNSLGVLGQCPEPSCEDVANGAGGVRLLELQTAWHGDLIDAPDPETASLRAMDAALGAHFSAADLHAELGQARPAMEQKLAMEQARAATPGVTNYDGRLGAKVLVPLGAAGLFRGGKPSVEEGAPPLSVSRLETFAQCGMRSFLSSVLGIREHETPEDRRGIAASERGQRVHEILEIFGVKSKQAGLLPWKPEDAESHGSLLESCVAEVIERVLRSAPKSQHALWEAERQRYNGLLGRWLRAEITHGTGEGGKPWIPEDFEWDFDGHGFELGDDGAPLWFRGRVDRVDLLTSEGGTKSVRIVDYKSGSGSAYRDDGTDFGKSLQLFLYGQAAASKFAAAASEGVYDFVLTGSQTKWSGSGAYRAPRAKGPQENNATAGAQVAALVHGMESGHFAPLPRSKGKPDLQGCTFCSMKEACGPWRDHVIGSAPDDPVGTALADALETAEAL
ncbi:MAG: RecB family exonuclease, partial [Planctomycetota bacterium]